MLKSRASKLEEKHLRVGSLRASTCNYLFSPRWNKDYTLGMRQKRAAQSTWRRLRFWMDSNPCLWKCLKTLNITISISDLVSTFDSHPEWFSEEGTCLEAIRAPLQRLGLYISLVPLSSLPHEVLERSGEICSKYLFWRRIDGIGHYALNFEPGDRCFEITNYAFLPGDLSWVFGSAKKSSDMRTQRKAPYLGNLTNSYEPRSRQPIVSQGKLGGDTGRKHQQSKRNSTTSSDLGNTAVPKWRGSMELKEMKKECGNSVTTDRSICPIRVRQCLVPSKPSNLLPLEKRGKKTGPKQRCSDRLYLKRRRETNQDCASPEKTLCPLCNEELELSDKENRSLEVILSCYKCGRGYHLDCSGIQHGWAGFKDLECSHYELSCCSKKLWTQTKEFAKKTVKDLPHFSRL